MSRLCCSVCRVPVVDLSVVEDGLLDGRQEWLDPA
jgi:hypothetical protein